MSDPLQPPHIPALPDHADTPAPEVLAETHRAAFEATEPRQSRAWSAAEFHALLGDRFTFAQGDGRCFALVRLIAGEAELLTIATHPRHQREGHARRVMQAWIARVTQEGASDAFLEVAEDNTAARRLYCGCGFGLVGIRKAYYPRAETTAVDALLMKRSLN